MQIQGRGFYYKFANVINKLATQSAPSVGSLVAQLRKITSKMAGQK